MNDSACLPPAGHLLHCSLTHECAPSVTCCTAAWLGSVSQPCRPGGCRVMPCLCLSGSVQHCMPIPSPARSAWTRTPTDQSPTLAAKSLFWSLLSNSSPCGIQEWVLGGPWRQVPERTGALMSGMRSPGAVGRGCRSSAVCPQACGQSLVSRARLLRGARPQWAGVSVRSCRTCGSQVGAHGRCLGVTFWACGALWRAMPAPTPSGPRSWGPSPSTLRPARLCLPLLSSPGTATCPPCSPCSAPVPAPPCL